MAAGSLVVVVAASVTMERAAAALGNRFAIPEIVVGGLVLAAVTSLPNAVAAVYLAARGRGAATLSTALNSNTINVAVGLLVPAALIGLGRLSGQTILAAAWYLGLTAVVLAFAYRDRGIWRLTGIMVIAAYLVFAGLGSRSGLRRAAGGRYRDRGWPRRRRRVRCAAGRWPPSGFRPAMSPAIPPMAGQPEPRRPDRSHAGGSIGQRQFSQSARTRTAGPPAPGRDGNPC